MSDHVTYWLVADGHSVGPFEDYWDALDLLSEYATKEPDRKVELVATQPSGFRALLDMPLLKPSEET